MQAVPAWKSDVIRVSVAPEFENVELLLSQPVVLVSNPGLVIRLATTPPPPGSS